MCWNKKQLELNNIFPNGSLIIPWSLLWFICGVFLWVCLQKAYELKCTPASKEEIFFYCSNLPQGQGFHADPLDQAFLQVPGVQQVLFYLEGPQYLTHPVCCYKERRLWKKEKSEKDMEFLCKLCFVYAAKHQLHPWIAARLPVVCFQYTVICCLYATRRRL